MKFLRLIACSSMIFFGANTLIAQKNFYRDAEVYFNSGMIERAIDSYKKAYEHALPEGSGKATKLGTKGYISYRLGDCYYMFRDVKEAQQYYERAIKLKYDKDQPDVYLKLGDVHKEQGNYRDAKDMYDKYYELTGDIKGKKAAESSEMAINLNKNKTRYKVAEEVVLNTEDYDFSPFWTSRKYDEIMFTSNRKGATGEEPMDRTGGSTKDLWHCERDPKGHWGQPTLLDATINTDDDEGAAVVDKRDKTIYFTRCEIPDKNGRGKGCDIYTAEKRGKSWGEATKIPLKGQYDSLGVGHPTLSNDERYMLFASDLPGGQGGVDIWMTEYDRREKVWKDPVNLGPTVNSPGNEMFPHLRPNGDLYISSDAHPGMGGMDIFKCKSTGEMQWGKPENMGVPINSNADDYGIIFEGDAERGLFTSNRKGKTKDDIYSFNLPPMIFSLTAYVFDKDTKEPITDAEIKVISEGNLFTGKTDGNGMVEFDTKGDGTRYITEGTNYNMEVGKQGEYLNGKQAFTTVGVQESKKFVYEFLLQTVKKPIRLPEIRYDFNKSELQVNDSVNSKDSLNYLYDLMMENPTIVVRLRSHTDCRGNDAYNRELAQRRAQSCVKYLVEEKGIPSERLVPLGMGEDEPLPGLDCRSIERLPTEAEREAAHQRNRRTDCLILSWDYVPEDGEDDGQG